MTPAPALFIGHGSPMNTLESNGYTQAWAAFGSHLPRPRAVLVISAHWYFGATAVTAMPRPLEYHVDVARRLAPLRERGVMVLASGNVVHNLRRIQWHEPDLGFDWARRFDDAVVEQMTRDPADILKVVEHPDYRNAVPTPDHFIPLLYLAGLAAAGGTGAEALVRGYSMGSLSMTCYGLGARDILLRQPTCAARLPQGIPPDQTNA